MTRLVGAEGERLFPQARVGWVDVADAGRPGRARVGRRFPLVVGEVDAIARVFVEGALVFDDARLERAQVEFTRFSRFASSARRLLVAVVEAVGVPRAAYGAALRVVVEMAVVVVVGGDDNSEESQGLRENR